jgi:DNA-binding NarL/FixJ family response regulator
MIREEHGGLHRHTETMAVWTIKSPIDSAWFVLRCREDEVAAMAARGLSNRQVAQELHLSERTVENHVSKILRKLDLAPRTEIAAWATEQRPIAPEPEQALDPLTPKATPRGFLI